MDADDVAFPDWLDLCLALLESNTELGFVGSGVLDIEGDGSPRDLHVLEGGTTALRWRALFSSPVFHNTVVARPRTLRGTPTSVRHVVRRDGGLRPLDAGARRHGRRLRRGAARPAPAPSRRRPHVAAATSSARSRSSSRCAGSRAPRPSSRAGARGSRARSAWARKSQRETSRRPRVPSSRSCTASRRSISARAPCGRQRREHSSAWRRARADRTARRLSARRRAWMRASRRVSRAAGDAELSQDDERRTVRTHSCARWNRVRRRPSA